MQKLIACRSCYSITSSARASNVGGIADELPLASITSDASPSNWVAHAPLKIDLNIAADGPAGYVQPLPEPCGAELSFRIVLGVEH